MKKLIITHLFLNLYLLALVQPAIPVLEYLINYDYIVNELCENREKPVLSCKGKCYLGDQIENQLNLNGDPQLPLPPEVELQKFISLTKKINKISVNELSSELNNPEYKNSLKDRLIVESTLKPPIV